MGFSWLGDDLTILLGVPAMSVAVLSCSTRAEDVDDDDCAGELSLAEEALRGLRMRRILNTILRDGFRHRPE